ncbi:MAG: hypothetical protein ACK55I_40630, partial [bacterium]
MCGTVWPAAGDAQPCVDERGRAQHAGEQHASPAVTADQGGPRAWPGRPECRCIDHARSQRSGAATRGDG